SIFVYGSPELSRSVRVGSDGNIRLPLLPEPVPASGSMPKEVETALAAAIEASKLFVNPYVAVTVAEYQSRPISVAGAVKRPTTFQAVSDVTLLEAIARADGLTPEAGDEVLVSRTDGDPALVRRIPIKSLIDAADPAVNLKLTGGEEIRIPEAGRFFVVGNVRRPGSFVIRDTAGMTLFRALALAEGLAPFAGKQAFLLRREETTGATNEIAVDLKKVLDRKADDVKLAVNDVLYIPDNSGRRVGMAVLEKALLLGTGATTALIYSVSR
ncbi:MAG TPA: SLBB domain-containing protein, partial [Bryobacteraceae bacterium]|nr:SLBB domain-containing protein [Bryobacteraceae bacterium]